MKVIVYVEGPSDKAAMEELLRPLIARAAQSGIGITFHPTEGKQRLITQTPTKAANILRNESDAVVIALPDLYPRNVGLQHETPEELRQRLGAELDRILARKNVNDDRLRQRFWVHCFKHDLEALILAATEPLSARLGLDALVPTWVVPTEDQNFNHPPKRVVEELFAAHGEKYQDTLDAPLILGDASYQTLAERCSQCFLPFVAALESLLSREET